MPMLSRRGAMSGAIAVAASAAVARLHAAAPPIGNQAPGFYRYRVGDIEITVVNDGVSRMPITDDFVANATRTRSMRRSRRRFWNRSFTPAPTIRSLSIPVRGLRSSIPAPARRPTKPARALNGRFLINLAAAGIDLAAIDRSSSLIITATTSTDCSRPTTPWRSRMPKSWCRNRAQVLDGRRRDEPRRQAPHRGFKNVRRVMAGDVLKRVRTYAWDKEVIPGVTAVGTPGHTPGHTSHVVASGSKSVYVQADVTHAPFLFARNPGWHFMLDVDPLRRKQPAARSTTCWSAERMLVQGFHYPFPSVGHVEKSGTGYREVLVNWSPTI